jgi:DNA-binding NtrC family response regulator
MTPQPTILLADDEPLERGSLSLMLQQEGYDVTTVEDGLAALTQLEKQQFDVVLTDIRMPRMTGMELLKQIKERKIESEVILITAYGEIKDAVEATKMGAYNFVEKNQNMDEELKLIIKRAIERMELLRENKTLKMALDYRNQFHQIIGQSSQMQEIYDLIDTVADTKATILIQGETGTGKDLVARAIHRKSCRSKCSFVKVNCAGVPENLLESEMFGHVKGAFTSAVRDKEGKFEVADGGTIFLDDIDTFPLELQAKLLRVLQDQQFERVGSTKTIEVDARIVSAANQNLYDLMTEGRFRADLFYRLNVVPIQLPPLRQRPGDIILLADHFLRKFSTMNNKTINGFSSDSLRMLGKYHWPGNVRELENVIERAVILERNSHINGESLMLFQQQPESVSEPLNNNNNDNSLKGELRYTEKEIILAALERNNWRRQKTAEELNINRVTLYNKMKKYGIADK